MEQGGFVPPLHEWLFLFFVFNWNPRTQALLLYLFPFIYLFFLEGGESQWVRSPRSAPHHLSQHEINAVFLSPVSQRHRYRPIVSARTNKQTKRTNKEGKKSVGCFLPFLILWPSAGFYVKAGTNAWLAGLLLDVFWPISRQFIGWWTSGLTRANQKRQSDDIKLDSLIYYLSISFSLCCLVFFLKFESSAALLVSTAMPAIIAV